MITIKTIKWLILLFINNFERKQRSNSAYQLSIPISNFEYAFTYWVKKQTYVCVLSKNITNVTRMTSLKSRWYLDC